MDGLGVQAQLPVHGLPLEDPHSPGGGPHGGGVHHDQARGLGDGSGEGEAQGAAVEIEPRPRPGPRPPCAGRRWGRPPRRSSGCCRGRGSGCWGSRAWLRVDAAVPGRAPGCGANGQIFSDWRGCFHVSRYSHAGCIHRRPHRPLRGQGRGTGRQSPDAGVRGRWRGGLRGRSPGLRDEQDRPGGGHGGLGHL